MATAKAREVEKVRVVEEKYTEIEGVTLELTDEEAVAVKAVLESVAGISEYREATSRVWGALNRAGYDRYTNAKVADAIRSLGGALYFS